MTSGKRRKKRTVPWKPFLKGLLCAVAASVVLILLLTLLLYLGWLKETAIPICNTVIKIVAAIVCGAAAVWGRNGGTWLIGGLAAAAASLLLFFGMSLTLGAVSFNWNLLADLLMSFAVGAASAALWTKLQK